MSMNRAFAIRAMALRGASQATQVSTAISSPIGLPTPSSVSTKIFINPVTPSPRSLTRSESFHRTASIKSSASDEIKGKERDLGVFNEDAIPAPKAPSDDEAQIQEIFTEYSMAPIGPYSQAVLAPPSAQLLFLSGQLPALASGDILDPDTPMQVQTSTCIASMANILRAAGSSLDKIVKTTVFLTDMKDFPAMNDAYERFIRHKPARSCVAVRELPKGVKIEIECVAIVG